MVLEYKLSSSFDVTVKKIENGYLVNYSHPDEPGVQTHYFDLELDAYDFAAKLFKKVIGE